MVEAAVVVSPLLEDKEAEHFRTSLRFRRSHALWSIENAARFVTYQLDQDRAVDFPHIPRPSSDLEDQPRRPPTITSTMTETDSRTGSRAPRNDAIDDGAIHLGDRHRLSDERPHPDSANVTTAIPDGGYGWTIVTCCSLFTFWFNGFSGSWGVLQTALLQSDLASASASTTSWVGSLSLACLVAFSLFGIRLLPYVGARSSALAGVALLSAGMFLSGFTTRHIGGLFATSGALVGTGASLLFVISNTIPTQYFNGSLGGKLGLANGLVKLGGGLGATVLSVALQALILSVGTAWTFRVCGLMAFVTGMPAAWLVKERIPIRKSPFVELSMFRDPVFSAVFAAGSLCVFALFVPPFFMPMLARSIGLSSTTGAALVAGFNLCTAIGRFGAGPLCDKIGPINMLLATMLVNATTMLAIWPLSNTLTPLVLFAILNGIANGGFFTCMPTAIAGMFGPGRAAVAMSMAITGWTMGYLTGCPLAGYLLQASDSRDPASISRYRPAIFYAGGMSLVASGLVLFARLKLESRPTRKV